MFFFFKMNWNVYAFFWYKIYPADLKIRSFNFLRWSELTLLGPLHYKAPFYEYSEINTLAKVACCFTRDASLIQFYYYCMIKIAGFHLPRINKETKHLLIYYLLIKR